MIFAKKIKIWKVSQTESENFKVVYFLHFKMFDSHLLDLTLNMIYFHDYTLFFLQGFIIKK